MTTVLLVDDQAMIRTGLRGILEDAAITVTGECGDGREGVHLARRLRPEIVLMDLRMPLMDGVAAIRGIRADPALSATRILVLTTFDSDPDVIDALSAGADGFLSKTADPEDLVAAVHAIGAGDPSLSPRASRAVLRHLESRRPRLADPELASRIELLTDRERDIVTLAASGHDNLRISRDLRISPLTVKTHINRAMIKLDARDRGQLVAFAYRSGLAEP